MAAAQGEASRFIQVLDEYNKAPLVTRDRLYLDAMEHVLSKSTKLLIDQGSSGNNVMYLPLDQLIRKRNETAARNGSPGFEGAGSIAESLAERDSRRVGRDSRVGRIKSMLGIVIIVILGVLGSSAVYVVDEREKAIVFQFGEIVSSSEKAGLYFKLPVINNVSFFDARIQTMDADPQLFLTKEKKNLVVDSFVKWRVRDARDFYTKLGGLAANARNRLAQRVNDALRQEFGNRSVQQVISGDRAEIMNTVRKNIDSEINSLGIEVVDVRLKRVDLDPDISERVYQRMEAERSRVAKDLRARGAEEAERIRADADRERAVTLANANREAEEIRGQGDAQATGIYAEAYQRDREFYRLYRSLNAYRATFDSADNLLVIEPNSEFFQYFKQAKPVQGD